MDGLKLRERVVAVVGATGAVGEEVLRVLEEVNFPVSKLVPLASRNSAGKSCEFRQREITIKELTETIFEEEQVEIAIFSAGGSISAHFAKYAAEAGAVVIDNTSHFRMDRDIPLVVPEVNPQDIHLWRERGIIANPNCSTIQMVQVLKPLDDFFGIKRVDVSTYQAVSGAGKEAMEELVNQMRDFFSFKLDESEHRAFPHQMALNLIPQIDIFLDNGYTKEEIKMVNETKKILNKNIELSSTCVRVPVLRGHSEAITIEFEERVDVERAKEILANSKNIVLIDSPSEQKYPMPVLCTEKNETFVGRVRGDLNSDKIVHLFVVADNLRVGAATNAVRIAQKFIEIED